MIFHPYQIRRFILSFFIFLLSFFNFHHLAKATDLKAWKVPAGYGVKVDSSDWVFPVAIQFIRESLDDPKSPLYYVAERQGLIKVVTQDRSVLVYADLRDHLQKVMGFCMDEEAENLYVTTIQQEGNRIFNNVFNYRSASGGSGLKGQKNWEMAEWFQKNSSNPARIGPCLVGGDQALYLGMDDGNDPEKTQSMEHLNGKILRMGLDGKAQVDNPFYDSENPDKVSSFVYAYGLRNPRVFTQGPNAELYTIDHSPQADRLLKVTPGKNGLWEGNEATMLMNSIATWVPSPLPNTMVFLQKHAAFAQWGQSFLIPSTSPARMDVLWVDSHLGAKAPPQRMLEYIDNQNEEKPSLGPIAIGPDGIYFSMQQEKSDIMKIVQDVSEQVSAFEPTLNGEEWFHQLECFSCHRISGRGGQEGPALDNLIPRLELRLASKQYEQQLEQMDQLTERLYVQYKEARGKVKELEGKDKVKFWIEHRLKEPRFDSINSQMPNLQLTEEQISALTQYLMTLSVNIPVSQKSQWSQWADDVKFYLTTHLWIWLGLMILIGGIVGIGMKTLFRFLWNRLFNKRRYQG